ncbi:MAG TPA: hypothetical protein DD727_05035 [Clostridiales bacterium]|nr:hypothetical protein [Clostridiales bacterium]
MIPGGCCYGISPKKVYYHIFDCIGMEQEKRNAPDPDVVYPIERIAYPVAGRPDREHSCL